MFGPVPESEADMPAEYDWTTAGCMGEANHEVYDAASNSDDGVDSTVMDDFYTWADDKVTNDPRVRQAQTAWSSCMAGKGFDFATSDDARQSIQDRFDTLTGSSDPGASSDPGSGSMEFVPPNPDLFSDASIVALHDDEIATATADAQCLAKSGLDKAYNDAYYDAETEFYSTHKTEVDAYFDALEAAQKG